MAIQHGICYSFKKELFEADHDLTVDVLKLALYQNSADLTLAGITAYTTTGEVSGSGYTAGGSTLTVATGFPKLNPTAQGGIALNQAVLIDFDDLTFSSVSISARAGLIYNSSKSNKAFAIVDFGQIYTVSGGDLTITWPTPDALSAIIRTV